MRDVANLAGVSQSTVSRVLSQKDSDISISEETNRKVFEAVAKLGYYPNLTARSLRTQRTHMIAVMIADISNPFYHFITRTIQDIAVHHDYDVLISNTDHIHAYEQRFCQTMMRRPVDGIVLIPYHLTNDDIDELLRRTGAAITVLGRHITHPGVDVVSADDEKATYDTVRWLIHEKGHHRIGFVSGPPHFSVSVRRQRGYERAMNEAGLEIESRWIQEGDFTQEAGQRTMVALLALRNKPTAVFSCNDIMAIGALNAARELNLRVPEDIAIVGFDNVPAATLVRPTLTTVAQYPIDMGRLLAEALFERIDGKVVGEQRRFDVRCELIVRQSA
jgi:LacI family transcriptional regulator